MAIVWMSAPLAQCSHCHCRRDALYPRRDRGVADDPPTSPATPTTGRATQGQDLLPMLDLLRRGSYDHIPGGRSRATPALRR